MKETETTIQSVEDVNEEALEMLSGNRGEDDEQQQPDMLQKDITK